MLPIIKLHKPKIKWHELVCFPKNWVTYAIEKTVSFELSIILHKLHNIAIINNNNNSIIVDSSIEVIVDIIIADILGCIFKVIARS